MSKIMQKALCIALCAALIAALAACGGPAPSATPAAPSAGPGGPVSSSGAAGDTYVFTDSTGREVELPRTVTRAASAGPLANIMLYAVKPQALVGWAAIPAPHAQKYIDDEYLGLPEYGKFYNNAEGFNREALMASGPEVIIDVGEWDEEYKAELDALQEQLGIPVILVEANLDETPQAFRTLGALLGDAARGEELAAYCEETLSDAREKAALIPDGERKTVYYGEGEAGLATILGGTIHAQVYELIGARVAADADSAEIRRGGGSVSLEQLLAWDPDVVVFAEGSIYDTVGGDPSWAALSAVRAGRYYEIPIAPYNWLSNPPGPNRMIGVRWLGNLVYPEIFDYDMRLETKAFYSLFYRYELSDAEVDELLGNSTLKAAAA